MKYNKKWLGAVLLSAGLILTACSTSNEGQTDTTEPASTIENTTDTAENTNDVTENESSNESGHGDMEHDESGDLPEGIKEAENPAYPVGSQVVIQNDHMPGMMGASGTVVGVFDTVAYEVTYQDTKTGETVANHKWVIHEELENPQAEPYQQGDEVILKASHMPGMEGASATIDSAHDTRVYMVTYTDTESGETIENHKWMAEDELSPAE